MMAEPEQHVTLPTDTQASERAIRRSALLTGVVLGIGIMGFLDETILHQLLQWHTFYWYTDQHGRILSDGLFHAFSTLLLLWGAFRLWRGRVWWASPYRNAIVAAMVIGAGAFNLYDGIVQHAIFHFHLVNELVCSSPASSRDVVLGICRNDLPYEIIFDLVALIILVCGITWWRSCIRRSTSSTLTDV